MAAAQPAPAPAPVHLLPQAIQIEQKETLEQLTELSTRKGEVGVEATKVLALMKKHMAREQEFILPPLTLLPQLADGNVTPDMAWALAMTDRVKAEREQLFDEHSELTEALNALIVAAVEEHEPTLLLINQTLHSKLPAAH
jgi:hypothetical protein